MHVMKSMIKQVIATQVEPQDLSNKSKLILRNNVILQTTPFIS
jgi:hypothetical protein